MDLLDPPTGQPAVAVCHPGPGAVLARLPPVDVRVGERLPFEFGATHIERTGDPEPIVVALVEGEEGDVALPPVADGDIGPAGDRQHNEKDDETPAYGPARCGGHAALLGGVDAPR